MNQGRATNVFVLMPSGRHGEYAGGVDEAEFVYENIILPSIMRAGDELQMTLVPNREIDNRISGPIPTSIVQKIATHDLSIVDITGTNANVLLELGMRYALKRNGTKDLCLCFR
jgi:hypothetical protein